MEQKTNSSFENAVAALYSPLHQSMTKEALDRSRARRKRTVHDMRTYLHRIATRPAGTPTNSSADNGSDERIGTKSIVATMHENNVRVIHVTGTKGKGSTCSMCEAIMRRHYGMVTGMFTSPHLFDIRERIRVGGQPVSKEVFAQAYWHIRNRLEEYRYHREGDDDLPLLPTYFRMLNLMALYIFSNYNPVIEVIILEVGMGGRYDATNCFDIQQNNEESNRTAVQTVCGVTMLDYDHTRVLGKTLEEIAWEKGGIFLVDKESFNISPKPFAVAATTNIRDKLAICDTNNDSTKNNVFPYNHQVYGSRDNDETDLYEDSQAKRFQSPRFFALDCNYSDAVLAVLANCAAVEGRGGNLYLVGSKRNNDQIENTDEAIISLLPRDCPIGLAGDHQRVNAQLALALCRAVMSKHGYPSSPTTSLQSVPQPSIEMKSMYRAISEVSWPGRCQIVHLGSNSDQTYGDNNSTEEIKGSGISLYLDGAHTVQSIKSGINWYRNQTISKKLEQKEVVVTNQNDAVAFEKKKKRVLIFWCSHERNPLDLMEELVPLDFEEVYLCRPDSERPSDEKKSTALELWVDSGRSQGESLTTSSPEKNGDDANGTWSSTTWPETLGVLWKHLEQERKQKLKLANDRPSSVVAFNLNATEALQLLNDYSSTFSAQVFVTGSLYMVGSMLAAINWKEKEAPGHLLEVRGISTSEKCDAK